RGRQAARSGHGQTFRVRAVHSDARPSATVAGSPRSAQVQWRQRSRVSVSRGESHMLRKQIVAQPSRGSIPLPGEIQIADVAMVQVSSESAEHPIDHAFDPNRGPGATRWVADAPGEQSVTLLFDRPQTIHQIEIEVEELAVSRTQELALSFSADGGRTYRDLIPPQLNFSPPPPS